MSHRVPITKEVAQQLREQLREITLGFDMLADHVIVTDPDGNVVYANPAALIKTGFSADEVIGANPGDLWGGQMPEDVYKEMWQTIKKDRRPWVGEVKNRKKDGSVYWQELRISPITGDHGELLCFVGIEPDITARKITEESKEIQLSQTKKLNEFFVGREQKVTELKEAIASLKQEIADYREGDLVDDEN